MLGHTSDDASDASAGTTAAEAPDAPPVSIITVTYNDLPRLVGTMNSVARLTYPAVEYVVIDGGSSDGTVEHLSQAGSLVTTWCSEPDGGLYDAMNKGIERATGRWLMFLNAGDTVEPWALDALLGQPGLAEAGLIGLPVAEPGRGGVKERLRLWLTRGWRLGMHRHHQGLLYPGGTDIRYDVRYRLSADYKYTIAHLARVGTTGRTLVDVGGTPVVYYEPDGLSARHATKRDAESLRISLDQFGPGLNIPFFAGMMVLGWLRSWRRAFAGRRGEE